eukprot:g1714.t1
MTTRISRRERFGHLKQGTAGQVTTRRPFNITFGTRSGTKIKGNVRRGNDGFEDLDDFFGEEDKEDAPLAANQKKNKNRSAATPPASVKSIRRSARRSSRRSESRESTATHRRQNTASPKTMVVSEASAASPEVLSPNKRLSFGAEEDFDDEPDGGDINFDVDIDMEMDVDVDDMSQEEMNGASSVKKSTAKRKKRTKVASTGKKKRSKNKRKSESEKEDSDTVDKNSKGKKNSKSGKRKTKEVLSSSEESESSSSESESDSDAELQKPKKRRRAAGDGGFKASRQSIGHGLPRSPANGRRRSKRRKWKPLEYWRGERLVTEGHGANSPLPTVIGASRAGAPTPMLKKKTTRKPNKTGGKKKKSRKNKHLNDDDDMVMKGWEFLNDLSAAQLKIVKDAAFTAAQSLAPVKLPKGYKALNDGGTTAAVWQSNGKGKKESVEMDVVRKAEDMKLRDLVPSKKRDDDSPCAQAAGSFDNERYVTGKVNLRPGAYKDVESVRGCTQIFNVVTSQKGAVEFKIADSTFLLSSGDHFFVPPHNTYGVRNFSKTSDAVINFVVLKPGAEGAKVH